MITGLVVALPEEVATLTKQVLAKGELAALGDHVLISHAGAGPLNAERTARQLIAAGARQLISWGCAAALSESLGPGDLMLPAAVIVAKTKQVVSADKTWHAACAQLLNDEFKLHYEALAASETLVALSSEKRAIAMECKAACLDMESAAIANVAAEHHLPFLVIRTIADPVTLSLPMAVSVALNGQGEIELRRLFRHLLSHPWEVPALISLGLNFHAARKTLKHVAVYLDKIATCTDAVSTVV